MDTNNWFFSRRNMVGMVLAIVAIVVHLVVGLGTMWPVIALSAWGIGVALTPAAPQPALEEPRTLVDAIEESTVRFRNLGVGQSSERELGQLSWTIGQLERHMDELAAQPILLQTVNEIAFSHVPTLVTAFEEVPDIARSQGIDELDQSLHFLNMESSKILNAIVQQKFKGLEDQRSQLEEKFSGVKLYLDGPSQGSAP
ncbi:hypothetical protein [Corynebacterium sp. H130]|uniref:hypothetical protein n=1 Tax=Corynebacterium sp. H130 TaxID=3133444 RepID=UPI0030B55AA9